MQKSVIDSFLKLKSYCEKENFCGWDPYDGLNSKIFQSTPLKYWDLARLAWIQGFKRSPINFRKLLQVPKEHNAKGIALFLTGYCNLYKYSRETGNYIFGTIQELEEKIHLLAKLLISLQSKGYSGACWGYNFDWQGKLHFYFPKNTPTIVVTSFCAAALMDAYEITKKKKYLELALSSADFILKDLQRTPLRNGYLFSYSPLSGNNTVYNASLMGSKLLARIYACTINESLIDPAQQSIEACISSQNPDGSWNYGERATQKWIDSFHTGFNLETIYEYMKYTSNYKYKYAYNLGFDFYIKNFFLESGIPKYYHNNIYPIDIHSPSQLMVTLAKCNAITEYKDLTKKVLEWTINNMQHSKKGFFYFQKKRYWTSKTPYMRWSQAWMFYALSLYLLCYE